MHILHNDWCGPQSTGQHIIHMWMEYSNVLVSTGIDLPDFLQVETSRLDHAVQNPTYDPSLSLADINMAEKIMVLPLRTNYFTMKILTKILVKHTHNTKTLLPFSGIVFMIDLF